MRAILVLTLGLAILAGATFFFIKSSRKQSTPAPSPTTTTQPFQSELITDLNGQLDQNSPNLPICPGAKLIKSFRKTFADKVGYTLVWESTQPVKTVMAWYTSELGKSGWTIAEGPEPTDSSQEQVALLTRPGYTINFIVRSDEDSQKTLISAESLIQ